MTSLIKMIVIVIDTLEYGHVPDFYGGIMCMKNSVFFKKNLIYKDQSYATPPVLHINCPCTYLDNIYMCMKEPCTNQISKQNPLALIF